MGTLKFIIIVCITLSLIVKALLWIVPIPRTRGMDVTFFWLALLDRVLDVCKHVLIILTIIFLMSLIDMSGYIFIEKLLAWMFVGIVTGFCYLVKYYEPSTECEN